MVTTPNPSWPLTVTQVAFNGGLNSDPSTLTWTDLSTRVWSLSADRGRQYELDQVQAGLGKVVFADKDENLNPANTGSPYYPNVLPYRPVLDQAMWPPTPSGAAVNVAGTGAGYDPDFETTTVGSTPPFLLTFNTTPVVSSSNPFSGSRSLQWSVLGNSTEQVTGFTISTIPGQQYTASMYVRQTAANTTVIFINGMGFGTSTTTVGSYVRLSVTFTAGQPSHQVFVGSFTPTLAATVNIDGVQVEPGASASAFSATGPVIYGVMRGYVERWPSKWNFQGMYGYAESTTVDAFAALAAKKLHTEFRGAVLAKVPAYYWPLADGSNATSFGEASGNGGPPLLRTDSQFGPAQTWAPGTSMNIPGDPGAAGIATTTSTPGQVFTVPATIAQTGMPGVGQAVLSGVGAATQPAAVSVAFWGQHDGAITAGGLGGVSVSLQLSNYNGALEFEWFAGTPNTLTFHWLTPGRTASNADANVTDSWTDSKPHFYVITMTVGAATSTVTGFVDGVQVGSTTIATTGFVPPYLFTVINVGALVHPTTGQVETGWSNGVYSHVAVWNRALSAQDVTDLWTAGEGYVGELSGARVARYLSSNYLGATSIDAGLSVMGASDLTESTTLLAACQGVTTTEYGNFWADGDGVLQFAGRTRRYRATTSTATFGESESPYEGDIAYDYDPTLIYNDVEVTQYGGVVASYSDTTSQTSYGPRTYQRTVNVSSSAEAIDAATWILSTHKDPQQRIANLVLRPSANPALWPVALGAEIGQRVTVKRRTNAGVTMTGDFFIEQISHDRKPDEWTVAFQMSPATQQVWILEDATYGVLDTTTRLAY